MPTGPLTELAEELSVFGDRSVEIVDRLAVLVPGLDDELLADRLFARGVLGLVDTSRSITASLLSEPALLDAVREATRARGELDAAQLEQRWRSVEASPDALRRFKRREFVRIAARDLSGVADLPSTGRELAALADVVVAAALEMAEPTVRLAIIGMGKLGGRELNYASDVDLIVVHEGDGQEAARAVRRFIKVMTELTAAGTVWRTDFDLRPEGPSGALSRSPGSYGTYYRQWAQPWEYQALIKTRYVAGDVEASNRFFDAIRPVVWGDQLPPGALDHIRELKDRVEQRATAAERQDVKRAPGGIRDVEFAVQLLQLVHGRNDPGVRSPSTLEALVQLVRAGHLGQPDADRLDESYCYLRTVEHRLQLRDEHQTHELPGDREGLLWLARVLGHRQPDPDDAIAAFLHRHERRLGAVRDIHARLFHRRTLEPVAASRPIAESARVEHLRAAGFRDPEEADAILGRLTGGLGPTSRLLRHLLPLVVDSLAVAADPDLALVRLAWITDGPTRGPVVAAAMRESPVVLDRLCRLLGVSGAASSILRREPATISVLEPAPEPVEGDRPAAYRAAFAEGRAAMGRLLRRDHLEIMAADVLDDLDVRLVGARLTVTADDLLGAALDTARAAGGATAPFAVVGLGRLGGRELSYSSDLDVIFLADTPDADQATRALAAAKGVVSLVHDPLEGGRLWEIDARLRPEGANAPLVATLRGAADYYRGRADLWELQSMLRLRHVAGDADIAARFAADLEPLVYRPDFGEADIDRLRAMKHRIEQERCPQDDRRGRHLKLGPGGLSDVEFVVQLLQLCHGHTDPAIRTPSTFEALDLLGAAGHLGGSDAGVLGEAYAFASRLRDRLYLEHGRPRDELPADPVDLDVVGSSLGLAGGREVHERWAELSARSREVTERVFYGEPAGQSGG